MSFVEKALPPPDVKEGSILKARILNIKKVTSQWKDDQGNPKKQLEFELQLDNGYKSKSWMAYYERPRDKSRLGKLALKFIETTKKDLSNVEEFLVALKQFGYVFVKCNGFREYEEELYPNFSVVSEKIPSFQQKMQPEETANNTRPGPEMKQFNPKQLLARFKDAIKFGLPLNQDDWNKKLLVEERLFLFKQGLIEKRQDLYHFTAKAQDLFQQ